MIEEIKKAFPPPYKYVPEGTLITDANNNLVLNVRGWGHLTGGAALNMDSHKGAEIQDAFGELVAKLLNRELS